MTRSILDFRGNCLVLCGGWNHQKHRLVTLNQNEFFTVDANPGAKPDAVMDITDRKSWQQFADSSFDFILIECMPNNIRNSEDYYGVVQRDNTVYIQIIFEECRRVLKDNGSLFCLAGSNPNKTYPEFLAEAGFQQSKFWRPPVITRTKMKGYINGEFSFASKSTVPLSQEFLMQNLPKTALEIIRAQTGHDAHFYRKNAETDLYNLRSDSEIFFDDYFLRDLRWIEERYHAHPQMILMIHRLAAGSSSTNPYWWKCSKKLDTIADILYSMDEAEISHALKDKDSRLYLAINEHRLGFFCKTKSLQIVNKQKENEDRFGLEMPELSSGAVAFTRESL